ncbi:MAG: AAA family ATPase [Fibrobacteres bacterium]|nr:AAA family ATPase [Fibrobacterota bacterium]
MLNSKLPRPLIRQRIQPWIGSALIKVITGQRRVGKSSFLASLAFEFEAASGSAPLFVQLESAEWRHIRTADDLLAMAQKHAPSGPAILMIDEVQEIEDFDLALRSLAAEERWDLYVTGSNAELLSGEIATRFAGRSITIEVPPLSYDEFLVFHRQEDSDESLRKFLRYGGLPFLHHLPVGRRNRLRIPWRGRPDRHSERHRATPWRQEPRPSRPTGDLPGRLRRIARVGQFHRALSEKPTCRRFRAHHPGSYPPLGAGVSRAPNQATRSDGKEDPGGFGKALFRGSRHSLGAAGSHQGRPLADRGKCRAPPPGGGWLEDPDRRPQRSGNRLRLSTGLRPDVRPGNLRDDGRIDPRTRIRKPAGIAGQPSQARGQHGSLDPRRPRGQAPVPAHFPPRWLGLISEHPLDMSNPLEPDPPQCGGSGFFDGSDAPLFPLRLTLPQGYETLPWTRVSNSS